MKKTSPAKAEPSVADPDRNGTYQAVMALRDVAQGERVTIQASDNPGSTSYWVLRKTRVVMTINERQLERVFQRIN